MRFFKLNFLKFIPAQVVRAFTFIFCIYLTATIIRAQTISSANNPWVNMGATSAVLNGICTGGTAATNYEWGVSYNNSSPVLRVTCTLWDYGYRLCTYPPYPTGDAPPFTWGGSCWFWNFTNGAVTGCPQGDAYQMYYYQNASGVFYSNSGNGCGNDPTVWRRSLR